MTEKRYDLSWIRSVGPRIGPLSSSMGEPKELTALLASMSEGILPLARRTYQRTVIQQTGKDTEKPQE